MSSAEVIWSLKIRVIHWGLAVMILLNEFIVEEGDPPHRYLGYAAVTVVLMRAVLGVIGKGHESFRNFPLSIKAIQLFVRTHFTGNHKFPGHNPLACLVYYLIWLSVLSLGVTGWMMGLDRYFGEDWVEDLHKQISQGLMILVAIHLSGVTLDSLFFKRKTWMGMVSGKRD